MNNLFIKNFNGKKVITFIWKGKPCWIARDIFSMFGYAQTSKSIAQCINVEKFELGIDYEVIKGAELRKFKFAASNVAESLKQVPKIIILYEEGIYGFLQYTEMPIGIDFRKWLRREVLPEIREKGTYSINDKEEGYYNSDDITSVDDIDVKVNVDNLDKIDNNLDIHLDKKIKSSDVNITYDNPLDKINNLKVAIDGANVFKDILDDLSSDSKYKLSFLKTLFSEAGIILPLYVDDEDII